MFASQPNCSDINIISLSVQSNDVNVFTDLLKILNALEKFDLRKLGQKRN